jgi:hypothetical protein
VISFNLKKENYTGKNCKIKKGVSLNEERAP